MIDLAISVSDRPVALDHYRYVETHAWWLGTFGVHQHLTEHVLRHWVPVQPGREWVLDHELTGEQRWLTGSAEAARADGFDLRDVAPTGRFRALHGEYDTLRGGDTDDADRSEHDYTSDLDTARADTRRLNGNRRAESAGGCGLPPRPPRRGSWQVPTAAFFGQLPRDPAVLLARLQEDNPGSWFGPFAAAVTSLRTGLVPADLREALYRAVCGLPGVSVNEQAWNVDGHECIAIVHDVGRTRTELMVDRNDGRFVGERDTLRVDSRCGLRAGTVISTTAVRSGVVEAVGVRPR